MQMLGTLLVEFQAIRLDGGRCFKGVHLSQVHQLINTCTNRSLFGTAETAAPHDPGRCLQILVDATCIFQPLITSKPIGCAAAGRYGRFFLQPICICRYLV